MGHQVGQVGIGVDPVEDSGGQACLALCPMEKVQNFTEYL